MLTFSSTSSLGTTVASDLSVTVVATVIGGLLLTAILAAWRDRNRLVRSFRRAKALMAVRRRQKERAVHAELVKFVRQRAEVLQIDVPISVSGISPCVVKFFPSGSETAYYRDFESYQAGVSAGRSDPRRSFVREPPRPLTSRSEPDLRAWLDEHRSHQPRQANGSVR